MTDDEGRRHFVRRFAVTLISDDDVVQDTCTVVAAGRVLRILSPADEIVALFGNRP